MFFFFFFFSKQLAKLSPTLSTYSAFSGGCDGAGLGKQRLGIR